MSKMRTEVGTVVVGTGAAALVAAISAHEAGSDVVIVEASDKIGGTTSISGGQPWIPMNKHMDEVGVEDSREDALTYLGALTGRSPEQDRLEAFVDKAASVIETLEEITPLSVYVSRPMADYHANLPGGKRAGRTLEIAPYNAREELGKWDETIRHSPQIPAMTIEEMAGAEEAAADPKTGSAAAIIAGANDLSQALIDRMAKREADGVRTCGGALVAQLLRGVLDRDIPIYLSTPARRLTLDGRRVTGVIVESEAEEVEIEAEDGVVLAAGGFEWNKDMVRTFLGVNEIWPISAPIANGDGLRLGLEAGGDLANMSVTWGCPVTSTGEEEYEGAPLHSMNTPRQEAGVIAVNKHGKRFSNEAISYHAFGRAHRVYDPVAEELPNEAPVWLIFDQTVRDRVSLKDMMPGTPTPGWAVEANTISELAEGAGLPVDELRETVDRWNEYVAAGEDPEFHRGTVWFEAYSRGGPTPEISLAKIENGPFYAIRLYDGVIGTAGGLRTDENARVRAMRGGVVEGLYAAGNTAASVFGPGYPGGGSTLGQALVFAYLAGQDLGRRHAESASSVASV